MFLEIALTRLGSNNLSLVNDTIPNTLFAGCNFWIVRVYTVLVETHHNLSERLDRVVELKKTVQVASIANILETHRVIGGGLDCLDICIWVVQLGKQKLALSIDSYDS